MMCLVVPVLRTLYILWHYGTMAVWCWWLAGGLVGKVFPQPYISDIITIINKRYNTTEGALHDCSWYKVTCLLLLPSSYSSILLVLLVLRTTTYIRYKLDLVPVSSYQNTYIVALLPDLARRVVADRPI